MNKAVMKLNDTFNLDCSEDYYQSLFCHINYEGQTESQKKKNLLFKRMGLSLIRAVCSAYIYKEADLTTITRYDALVGYCCKITCKVLDATYHISDCLDDENRALYEKSNENITKEIVPRFISLLVTRDSFVTIFKSIEKAMQRFNMVKIISDVNSPNNGHIEKNIVKVGGKISSSRKSDIVEGFKWLKVDMDLLSLEQANAVLTLSYINVNPHINHQTFLSYTGEQCLSFYCLNAIYRNRLKQEYDSKHIIELLGKDKRYNKLISDKLFRYLYLVNVSPTEDKLAYDVKNTKKKVFLSIVGALWINGVMDSNVKAMQASIFYADTVINPIIFSNYTPKKKDKKKNENKKTQAPAQNQQKALSQPTRVKGLKLTSPQNIIDPKFINYSKEYVQATAVTKHSKPNPAKDIIKIIPSEKINNVSFDSYNTTLIIFKGTFRCRSRGHQITSATGLVSDLNGKRHKINVNYCANCDCYFLGADEYRYYKRMYGAILGNFELDYSMYESSYSSDYAETSILKVYGYTVDQGTNLSSYQRQGILAYMMDKGILSKARIIDYLNFFIRNHSNRDNYTLAVKKWKEDLEFVRNYCINTQRQFEIQNIKKNR